MSSIKKLSMPKSGKTPERIREKILIKYDFSCCICGQKYFIDVHHIKPRNEGGNHKPSNLVVLCPTCHRAADRGVYSRRILRKLGNDHINKVQQIVASRTDLGLIQEKQIWSFIYRHCIAQKYLREEYLKLKHNKLYFIVFDLSEIGLICDPADARPILICDKDIVELFSIEVINNPYRMMFIEEWQLLKETPYTNHYLIRVDITISVGELNIVEQPKDKSLLDAFRGSVRKLIRHEFSREN